MSDNPEAPNDDVRCYPGINPRPRTRPGTIAPPPAPSDVDPDPVTPMPKTVLVLVNGKEKRRATGSHEEGWCKAPVKNQFREGNKGGGRPRGSKSQDTLLKAELDAKQSVKVGGRNRNVAKRVLIAKLLVNGALEKRDHRQLVQVNAEARRLYPEQIAEPGAHQAYNPAADRQALQQLLAQLALGEPIAEGADPLEDVAIGGPDLGEASGDDAWEEGDWNAVDEEGSDEDR